MDLQSDIWRSSFTPKPLKDGEIDVWRVDLDRDPDSVCSLFKTLSRDEQQRAGRFHFAKDRGQFVIARGSLRKIIGGYLALEPDRIDFSYNAFGKPFLELEETRLRFNVSHSRGFALVAVASGREVGIDIEFVDDDLDVLTVAHSVFSQTEISILEKLPSALRPLAFFKGWTRKEAYLKALGKGFSERSGQLSGTVIPDEPNIPLGTTDGQNVRDWSLVSLPYERDYMAALAVESRIGTIRYWQLTENEGVNLSAY